MDKDKNASGRIQAVDRRTVSKICSGQVVVELSVAVKELIENAIDAGATTVDVKLREHGTTAIEVSDNGSGISPDNYVGLTAKYHTSKLSSFDDLEVGCVYVAASCQSHISTWLTVLFCEHTSVSSKLWLPRRSPLLALRTVELVRRDDSSEISKRRGAAELRSQRSANIPGAGGPSSWYHGFSD
jgi:hypothetical protein